MCVNKRDKQGLSPSKLHGWRWGDEEEPEKEVGKKRAERRPVSTAGPQTPLCP